jgi:arylsulfatase
VAHDYLWWFHSGNRAIRVGDWKLVSAGADAPWELYNLTQDRSETRDLASSDPDRAASLARAWTDRLEKFRALATRDPQPAPETKTKVLPER